MSPAGRPARTTPEAWATAALDEIEEAGVRGMSVQSVARRLGVSKGGLYHHFADRRALLRAAMHRWERRQVTELNARFDAVEDPRRRLRELLGYSFVDVAPTVVLQLMAAADDPDVAAVLERSAEARLGLLTRILTQLGLPADAARHRAVMGYSHYLGLAQLRTQSPGVLSTDALVREHLDVLEGALLAGVPTP
ncbi:TetR/AcrR family transcriptional regulator [Patulibacter sp.]|uniref:TetR/AcrR family transcriptional regulator n=1 Tax=Patulibacter sp. TaxID=1912859 RepID=UPI00272258CF|nr:TetR/AcrR family transcriptional regulator [Patulibacter sp.]MDO9407316.1 TetR/AcrR family transcriptional regulator [Patulibacter sp.]